jgi:hypothetical protein
MRDEGGRSRAVVHVRANALQRVASLHRIALRFKSGVSDAMQCNAMRLRLSQTGVKELEEFVKAKAISRQQPGQPICPLPGSYRPRHRSVYIIYLATKMLFGWG